jgi:hypothetical protein
MPVTRSVNNFATTIVNTILENAFNSSCHCRDPQTTTTTSNENTNTNASANIVIPDVIPNVLPDNDNDTNKFGCCSICLEDIEHDKGRFVLECGHTFHAKCILLEFQNRNRCPMCRTEIAESIAHKRSYIMPSSLHIYSSIIHDAADHFIHDLGNITCANVVHRMLLLTSENQDLRSIQYSYIKRLLVQFASVFIRGIAFSVRGHDDEIQESVPVDMPIDIVDNMMHVDMDGDDQSDYDAAISNPSIDAAVAYQAIVTTDMNFDSSSHNDNVSSALIRRSVALAAMGSQRAELALRRATRMALRRQQMQDVHRLLQEAVGREQAQVDAATATVHPSQPQPEQNVNIVISEHEEVDEHSNPYGLEF